MSDIISYAGLDELWEAWTNHAYGPHDERPPAPRSWEARAADYEDVDLRWHPVGTLIAWSEFRHTAIVLDDGWLVDGKLIGFPGRARRRECPIMEFVEALSAVPARLFFDK